MQCRVIRCDRRGKLPHGFGSSLSYFQDCVVNCLAPHHCCRCAASTCFVAAIRRLKVRVRISICASVRFTESRRTSKASVCKFIHFMNSYRYHLNALRSCLSCHYTLMMKVIALNHHRCPGVYFFLVRSHPPIKIITLTRLS